MAVTMVLGAVYAAGCASRASEVGGHPAEVTEAPQVVVVAPALNLSNSADWDPLQFTDLIASELQAQPGWFVIPVNRAVAQLQRMGKPTIETAEDAEELARRLEADAVVVAAITEYDPYDPPRVSLILQLYTIEDARRPRFDPVAASRGATESATVSDAAAAHPAPMVQIQASLDAADVDTLELLRTYAAEHGGRRSPHDWRYASKSQREFLRFCSWAAIVSMNREWKRYRSQTQPVASVP
ncbi:MAG: hypothetical protein D6744_15615 [Planctomycetota bacterium]|nr:MAG: hypothetical protein D6744_15615 [Planctomycetota bacterium]